ncbi:TetR family transcriptional regulator [Salinisphaera sp. Q1T1-3]|uniref:TetR family transcriptional regulator n=1 Tax=Salinisphaera sp. Q1T1-3 TaxID=2321229 RepID=UPI000E713B92|nr:TetR family transcriptional regulator [Salinisphaera sp. Q1T1-3]RJS94367.1 TetR family transcriptional regulator [Salinisphaera sp. Q1T1-3]
MARKTKSESEQTREHILDAAEAEMLDRGVGKASLERIAQRANVTRGAIYWHFEDKSALLAAMVARTKMPMRDLRQCLSEHIPGAAPLELLKEMMLHGVNRLATDDQHRRVCHIVLHRCEIDQSEAASARLLAAMFDETRAALVAISHEVAEQRSLPAGLTAEDIADMIMAYMAGLYECSLRHPDTYRVEHGAETKIEALLNGLFPLPSPEQTATSS